MMRTWKVLKFNTAFCLTALSLHKEPKILMNTEALSFDEDEGIKKYLLLCLFFPEDFLLLLLF